MSIFAEVCESRVQSLSEQVGRWSQKNFENNTSKWVPGWELGGVADTLGILEEIGELYHAVVAYDTEGRLDAIGDIMIYMADYSYRHKLHPFVIDWDSAVETLDKDYLHFTSIHSVRFMALVREISHVNLKSHQGIRGYGEIERRNKAVSDLLTRIVELCAYYVSGVGTVSPEAAIFLVLNQAEQTWQKVSQRDWVKNKADAHLKAE